MKSMDLFANIDPSWKPFFQQEQQKPYFNQLIDDITKEYSNYECFPAWEKIFRVFCILPLYKVNCVLIGQDPYYKNQDQADGLAFSLKNTSSPLPPSLRNLFKELQSDLNIDHFNNGDLSEWAKQGLMLFNTLWTVRKGQPLSHKNLKWQIFTNNLVKYLNLNNLNLVYVLLGRAAQQTFIKTGICSSNIIIAAHPSPLSYRFFQDSKIFSKINDILKKYNQKIDWSK